jgi:hypothetical protein
MGKIKLPGIEMYVDKLNYGYPDHAVNDAAKLIQELQKGRFLTDSELRDELNKARREAWEASFRASYRWHGNKQPAPYEGFESWLSTLEEKEG